MAEQYDVVIIGSGPAGGQIAKECNQAGLSVALVESYGFGGTCPLRGCEPKKVLVDAADAVGRVRDMADQGPAGDAHINWPELMRFNRSKVDPISDKVESYYNQIGIDTYFAPARFVGPNSVAADDEVLEGGHVVIASGAKPRPLDIPGFDLLSTSEDFLKMPELPQKIVFMGGGFISFELGHVAARAGAEVTILEVFERPLAPFDPDLVDKLMEATRDLGVAVKVNSPVLRIEENNGRFLVRAGEDGDQTHEADMVVHGAGRVPAVDALDLAQGGVDHTKNGVTVNEYMQSVSNPQVYAAGDAADTPLPLTPVGVMEGKIVAHNIINGPQQTVSHHGLPSAVFTYPVLAAVGLKEDEATKAGLDFEVIHKDTSKWTEHQRIGLEYGGFKVLYEKGSKRLIGAHILGQRAEEIINVFALAMQQGLTLNQLQQTVWAYPSFIYNMRYVIM